MLLPSFASFLMLLGLSPLVEVAERPNMPDAPAAAPMPSDENPLPAPPCANREFTKKFSQIIYPTFDPEPGNAMDVIEGRIRVILLKEIPTKIQIVNDRIICYKIEAKQVTLTGKMVGETSLTFWFPSAKSETKARILTLDVRVISEEGHKSPRSLRKALGREIDREFPGNKIAIDEVGEQWAVRGNAKDAHEAVEILRIIGENRPNAGLRPVTSNPQTPSRLNWETFIAAGGPGVINLIQIPLSDLQVVSRVDFTTDRITAVAAPGPMNLADVTALSMCNVSDEVILNQIRTTHSSFRLGTEDILFLKKNGVSDQVVLVMQNTQYRNEKEATPPPPCRISLPLKPWTPAPEVHGVRSTSPRTPWECPAMLNSVSHEAVPQNQAVSNFIELWHDVAAPVVDGVHNLFLPTSRE